MDKKKKKKKGFTLIEMLVVVLIIGVLSAIAFPIYTRAVEKSRAANPMANLSAIAKAQNARMLATYHYTNDMNNLDISLIDESSGERATGGSFDTEYFTYRVYGDDRGVATATRKNATGEKQYELSVNYGTGQIFCRPMTNKTCIDLNLEEGQDYSQVPWNSCDTGYGTVSCYERENNGHTETMKCSGWWFADRGLIESTLHCQSITYRDNIQVVNECAYADSSDGFCNSYSGMWESEGEIQRYCLQIEGLECKNWSDWYIPTGK